MSYCDYSDLPPEMCSHCLGLDTKNRPGTAMAEAWTSARYSKPCQLCGNWINEGDRIGLADQVWLCEGCFE